MIVVIDYFTKWVETEPVMMITKVKITIFAWKNINYRFRVSRVIISNNGK